MNYLKLTIINTIRTCFKHQNEKKIDFFNILTILFNCILKNPNNQFQQNIYHDMERQLVFPSFNKIMSNGEKANDDIERSVMETIKTNNVVVFKDIVDKENLTFSPEIYCDIVKLKAVRIFYYLFVETRTKKEQKNIDECYKNIQDPSDAGMCGKRSANQKPVTKTFNVGDFCSVPQSIFEIAAKQDDSRILQFVIACGVPIDIITYNDSRKSPTGWCSSLSMSMKHMCKPNFKKANAIMDKI